MYNDDKSEAYKALYEHLKPFYSDNNWELIVSLHMKATSAINSLELLEQAQL